jgi:hypothetical protein
MPIFLTSEHWLNTRLHQGDIGMTADITGAAGKQGVHGRLQVVRSLPTKENTFACIAPLCSAL